MSQVSGVDLVTRALSDGDFGAEYGIALRHCLAHSDELWRRMIVNNEPAKVVARKMGFPKSQVTGAGRLLQSLRSRPSPERMALVVMRDPGLDDADIAEIFGRSVRWAELVRSRAEEIRSAEPIRLSLEYLDGGLQPGDPTPNEIARRAVAVRAERVASNGRRTDLEPAAGGYGIRSFTWSGYAFLPHIA